MTFYSPTTPTLGNGSLYNFVGRGNGTDTAELDLITSSTISGSNDRSFYPNNLYADLTKATASDIATLRTAFQLQKMLEKDARYGSRYNEFLLGHFGVISPDARLQFSEYLGGGRIPISIQQVSQTSAPFEDAGGDTTSPMGSVAANSQSVGRSRYSKGFVEHGFVITVGCIKQLHTYQQGVPRYFFRKKEKIFTTLCLRISPSNLYIKRSCSAMIRRQAALLTVRN